MPKLQMVYFVNNNGITSDKLYEGMVEWTKERVQRKVLTGIVLHEQQPEESTRSGGP